MYKLSETIEIAAQPERVFSLLCDVEKRIRLNPIYEVVRLIRLTEGKIQKGSRFQVQLKEEKNSFAYAYEVIELIENKKLELKAAGSEEFQENFALEKIQAGTRVYYTLDNFSEKQLSEKEKQDVQLWLISLKQYVEMQGTSGRVFKFWMDRVWLRMPPSQRRMVLIILLINGGLFLMLLLAILLAIILRFLGVEV